MPGKEDASAHLHEAVEQGGLAMLNQDVAHFHLCTQQDTWMYSHGNIFA